MRSPELTAAPCEGYGGTGSLPVALVEIPQLLDLSNVSDAYRETLPGGRSMVWQAQA